MVLLTPRSDALMQEQLYGGPVVAQSDGSAVMLSVFIDPPFSWSYDWGDAIDANNVV